MNIHLVLLLAYSVLLVLLGLWIGRRVRTTGDFFVAGRRLGPALLFSTMLAANIGAGSTVGAAGLGYRDGLSAWWWVGSAGLGSLALAFWIGPRIRREAEARDLRTVGDYLEWRYSPAVRGAVALLLWLGTLAILAGQLIAIAVLLRVVAGVPHAVGCLIGGIVMTTYFTAGGLLTSAWVNAVQLVVLLAGFVVALPLALAHAGGWSAVVAATPAAGGYWNIWRGGASGWMYLALLGPAFIVSPGLLQKIYGARDDRAVRIGVGANAVALLAFAFIPPLLGIIARARFPDLGDPQLALPTVMMTELPLLFGTLGLAAVFSAEVSTCDAILFMLATSLSQDLYRRFVDPQASDRRVLRVARAAAIAGGAAGVGIAIASPTIIGVLSLFYTLLGVSLFVPIVAGLYMARVGAPEAIAAIGAGIAVTLAVQLGTDGRGIGGLTPPMVGLIAAASGCAGVLAARASSPGGARLAGPAQTDSIRPGEEHD